MRRRMVRLFLSGAVLAAGLLALAEFLAPLPRAVAAEVSRQEAKSQPVVAVFRLDGPITESPAGEAIPLFEPPGTSLRELVDRLKKAAADPSVKAVVLLDEGGSFGIGQLEELRQAVGKVKSAGKDVLAHSDSMGMGKYGLLCAASRLSVSPTADLWLTGFQGESLHLRGLLDLLGVRPDFMTCGEYKSAAELFTRSEPSPEADRMLNWLLDGMYDSYVNGVAKERKLTPEKVRALIDGGPYTAEAAKAAGLIDAVEHRQDFEAVLKQKYGPDVRVEKKYGRPKQPTLDFSSPFAAFKIWADILAASQKRPDPNKPAVAIVYVDGPIMEGTTQPAFSPFGGSAIAMSSDVRRALDKAANDDSIKAVVLRVDSPGGSAVASEIILDATKRVKAKKPFVVSMGDVAGSGGYYVACGADTIFADEATMTASIGVVSGKLVTTEMWRKVGITFKDYKRGKNAGMLSGSEPFSDAERQRMRAWMDEVYQTFRRHVTEARGDRLKKSLDELAGGRVFTGRQALDLGLVDQIGTLDDAIGYVAEKAKLSDGSYEVRTVPAPKNLIELLLAAGGHDDEPGTVEMRAPPRLAAPGGASLVDLAAPYLRQLDPQRVASVKSALGRLELLRREGVILGMPEIVIPQ